MLPGSPMRRVEMLAARRSFATETVFSHPSKPETITALLDRLTHIKGPGSVLIDGSAAEPGDRRPAWRDHRCPCAQRH